jgi:chemotaxis family two-component system sensor histidine kinase/response regulator PixL
MPINTLSDREWEVRLLFLDEVRDFLKDIETEVIGLSDRGLQRESANKILRAAHSMKGGAAMMGFDALSEFAHQLEDFFKILQADSQIALTSEIEALFLEAIDGMGKVARIYKQRQYPEQKWLNQQISQPFQHLRGILGELSTQHEASLLSEEAGQDMRVLMFSTEVDACLNRLANVLTDPHSQVLREEFLLTSQEFGCLGEMLDLPAFTNLCQEIAQALEAKNCDLHSVTNSALEMWRRSQALVLVGQFQALPEHFKISAPAISHAPSVTLNGRSSQQPSSQFVEDYEDVSSKTSSQALETQEESSNPTVRVPLRQLEILSDRFGEMNTERSGLRIHLQRMRELVQLLSMRMHKLEQSNAQLREVYDRVLTSTESLTPSPIIGNNPIFQQTAETFLPYANRFDLLEMDRYSELHVLSREIMDSVVQLQEVYSDLGTVLADTEATERELGRTSRQMQTAIEQTRMRMLSEILDRFPRLLRDLSLAHGKQVELLVRGSSTLVERSVLEKLEDPLLHLIRNAFDHGLETPEERIAAGKSPKGRIEIASGYRGNQTVITISDDGRGINLEKLRDRALQMGISEADLANSTQAELLELIFEAGFSTAEQVTALSGRGVGMDVVRSNLDMIGGSVRIETAMGKGTSFILTVPVSLSIARILLFESNNLQMALLTSTVEEILLVRNTAIYTAAGQAVIDWEGYSVPIIKLGDRLQFSRPQFQSETENRPIIDEPLILMVARNNVPFGLQVDRYWGEQEVTIRAVQSPIAMPVGFGSCAILGGGKLVPIVDIDNLLDWAIAEIKLEQPKPPSLLPNKSDRRSTILVVDDSINVRRFLAMTLEKAGYRVEQAKDGYEAIERLRKLAQSPTAPLIKAVICDIEMPRLDGFGFLVQSRSDAHCQNIPVIMLTSRSGAKHRDLAMRLGAAAYFAKPFKDNELLQTIAQLTHSS